MIHKTSSQHQIGPKPSPLNSENKEEFKCDSASLNSTSEQSQREGSVWRSRGLIRKPDGNRSNFQSYKQIKRKSQDKQPDIHQNKMEQPPKCPRPIHDLTQSCPVTDPHSQLPSLCSQGQLRGEAAKFKKKAMSKEEIIEVKEYVRRLQLDRCETNSVGVSQQAGEEGEGKGKEANKKSKTQYFSIEEIHGWAPVRDITENSSESEGMYIVSLKEKCKSVDQNNSLLQKRLKWLMQEIEVHLERQANFQKEREALVMQLIAKDKALHAKIGENVKLLEQLGCREEEVRIRQAELRCVQQEMGKLREFVIALNLKFEDDRQILISEIQYLKSEQQTETEEREAKYQRRIRQLQERIQQLEGPLQENSGATQENTGGQYSQALIEKLVSENKYLKMENHMLARYKEDVAQLKRENKQIANQRDGLKKKIIESVKKEALKFRMMQDSDTSSLMSLSELSISIPQRHTTHHQQSTP